MITIENAAITFCTLAALFGVVAAAIVILNNHGRRQETKELTKELSYKPAVSLEDLPTKFIDCLKEFYKKEDGDDKILFNYIMKSNEMDDRIAGPLFMKNFYDILIQYSKDVKQGLLELCDCHTDVCHALFQYFKGKHTVFRDEISDEELSYIYNNMCGAFDNICELHNRKTEKERDELRALLKGLIWLYLANGNISFDFDTKDKYPVNKYTLESIRNNKLVINTENVFKNHDKNLVDFIYQRPGSKYYKCPGKSPLSGHLEENDKFIRGRVSELDFTFRDIMYLSCWMGFNTFITIYTGDMNNLEVNPLVFHNEIKPKLNILIIAFPVPNSD